jgi:hypothetical protein
MSTTIKFSKVKTVKGLIVTMLVNDCGSSLVGYGSSEHWERVLVVHLNAYTRFHPTLATRCSPKVWDKMLGFGENVKWPEIRSFLTGKGLSDVEIVRLIGIRNFKKRAA